MSLFVIVSLQGKKTPKSTSTKRELLEWLKENNVPGWDNKSLRPHLWKVCKKHLQQNPEFSIDHELRKHGIEVLRLPPYHPEVRNCHCHATTK